MRRGGGGGLYGNFVSASSNVDNKAYRGAEIPPPECLNAGPGGRGGRGPGPGSGSGPVIGGFGGGAADKGGEWQVRGNLGDLADTTGARISIFVGFWAFSDWVEREEGCDICHIGS